MRREPGAPHGAVSSAYQSLVARGALSADPAQRRAAKILDRIADELSRNRRTGLVGALISRRRPVRGAYLYGEVGRGKSMLMDLFFSAAPLAAKRRVHFHEFMDEMHEAIAAFRASGRSGDADPVKAVAKTVIARTRLLCLDEFHVQDIANAMLLGRLFERLFEAGVVLVATANLPPDRLYENGLNRQLFTPFIELLTARVELVPLDAVKDYRRDKFVGREVFFVGVGEPARHAMDAVWGQFTGGVAGRAETIESLGREIAVSQAAMGAARFDFADLCERPLGARDYLRLAHAYDGIVIDDVPAFDRRRSDAAKRFILLIDTLYDRGVKLAASFAVPLEQLAGDAHTRAEFGRTLSRLMEMQSEAYLGAPPRTERVAAAAG